MKNVYISRRCKVIDVINETSDVKTFRLDLKSKHDPGQFFEAGLLRYGEAPIGVCSYSNKYVELCIRDVGNVTHAIHRLGKGDGIWVRGPYGNGYPVKEFKNKDLVLIGGGTGAGPIRSVIEYVESKRKSFGDVDVFLGFRTSTDVLFKRDMGKWDKKFRLHLTIDKPCDGWTCSIGYVSELIEKAYLKPRNKIVLMCGPPIMINSVVKLLKKKGLRDEQIYVSLERLMQCGLGKCGHCMIKDRYVCKDGPVFNYKEAKYLED